jgi:amino acid adenylation domain-containing protein
MPSQPVTVAPPLPRLETLHAILAERAEAHPDAVAALFGEEEVRYARLQERSHRLARALRQRGLGRGSVVALLLPRSIDHLVGMFGILEAGACCVPLDPEDPPARLDALLGDCDPAALLTAGGIDASPDLRFPGPRIDLDAAIASADDEADEDDGGSRPDGFLTARPDLDAQPRDLAFVLYIPGSDGRPKGVMLEHHNVARLARTRGDLFGLGPLDRVYQGAAPGTDRAIEEIFLAIEAGGTLVVATREMALAGPHLPRLLTLERVTVLSTTPSLLASLHGDAPTVRLVLLEGEPCPRELLARWERTGRRLVLVYGATETSGLAACCVATAGGAVHFGPAVPGVRVRIADPELRPLGTGEVGEICVGGAGVARGYFGRGAESWARFVHDPWAPADLTDARVFRTGDYGRIDAQGNLHLLGRADGQARLRGRRVEMEEIERQIQEIDGVQAAACAVRSDGRGAARLGAWVVRRPGSAVDGESLRSALRTLLPAATVPARIEIVESLPRLENGALDRAALPESRPADPAPPERRGAPRTVAEVRIAALWDTLFAPHRVARDDHFFLDLGGHSLLAGRMIGELRRDPWFAHARVEDVYDHPTVASLAKALLPSGSPDPPPGPRPPRRPRRAARRPAAAGFFHGIGLSAMLGIAGSQVLTFLLGMGILRRGGAEPLEAAAWAAVFAVLGFPLALRLAAAASRPASPALPAPSVRRG